MTTEGCQICERQANSGEDETIVYEDDQWIARHSTETNVVGYIILESKRHFLDLSEANDDEIDTIAYNLQLMTMALRQTMLAERVYMITLAEAVPHFHVHFIPRGESFPKRYRGRGVLAYPLTPAADTHEVKDACSRLRSFLNDHLQP